jgi:transcription-repair coupling factor (superfamily II helicase)
MADTALDLPRSLSGVERPQRRLVASAIEGLDALYLARLVEESPGAQLMHVARDAPRANHLAELIAFFAPRIERIVLPAWDCLPYDRVSPNRDIMASRLEGLASLLEPAAGRPRLILVTVGALLQRVPPPEVVRGGMFRARAGERIDREALLECLARNGYRRSGTVVEPGEYAVRGGIIDVFPPGSAEPLRLDLFGDVLEAIRGFDPLTQRSLAKVDQITLRPVSEVMLDPDAAERFRIGYLRHFGAATDDPLFESVSAGRAFPGMEHWLPLFHDRLVDLSAYLEPVCPISLDPLADEAMAARQEAIGDYYQARLDPPEAARSMGAAPYRPLPPDELYLSERDVASFLAPRERIDLSSFAAPPLRPEEDVEVVDLAGRPARDFAAERAQHDRNLFDAVAEHVRTEEEAGRRVVIAAASTGSLERLHLVLADHGVEGLRQVASWSAVEEGPGPGLAVLPLDHGFVTSTHSVLAEPDIFGERLARPARRARRPDKFIADVAALSEDDFVVHADHGIGRFDGLVTLEISDAPHDCLRLIYQGGDKLFVPVENLDLLSRYGSADGMVQLDKLGGLGWQTRKAKVKQRIREIAGELIEIAARRTLRQGNRLAPTSGLYEEFVARFAYEETEDQQATIEAVLDDLASGRPMDRLICGDVGFGKTEVALRAAFVAAMAGRQVAILAPTTLLVRQHHQVMRERFAGLPLRIEQLSRFVTGKQAAEVREGLESGRIDIVVGTHALLAPRIKFMDLGLVIVDEEQHFGVVHKERLKQLRAEVHVLTMTATPIPRTLQMALGGLKELSIIATPPLDRLAVRAFVLPADPVVIREAILREHYRGGQTFYVCPRIEDQPKLVQQLKQLVPEVKLAVANGRMPPKQLDEVMTAFYDRQLDLLVTTNIIESGLDIPSANTLIVHRADRFGLSQLYQLRGRIGRGKMRGYAYFTLPPKQTLREAAERRLQVIQGLDQLGAGFQLASHDLDIRGAGNLLGDEQSGHIKEVGFELYNHMLEEAVALARSEQAGDAGAAARERDWTPQITIDAAALIPESYIEDLDLRLQMYRRLAALDEPQDIEAFAAELIDRFGPLPEQTEQLLQLVGIKQLCRRAGVDKVEAGPKGILIGFHNNTFEKPERLVGFIAQNAQRVKLRPDHRLVIRGETGSPEERLKRVRQTVRDLAQLAA